MGIFIRAVGDKYMAIARGCRRPGYCPGKIAGHSEDSANYSEDSADIFNSGRCVSRQLVNVEVPHNSTRVTWWAVGHPLLRCFTFLSRKGIANFLPPAVP